MQRISQDGLTFIEKWEELVLYVYDDKVPKRRNANGHLAYVEWDGGEVRGTLTIGYGHTDAAGAPKIYHGLRITEAQANEILANDLAACEADVRRIVKVPLGQHQHDALVSADFNFGAGNLRKLAAASGLNDGNYDDVPRHLLNYVTSKGERMQGLVNRRNGEIALWNKPDNPETAAVNATFSPKAEENAPPKSIVQSKSGAASATVIVSGVAVAIDTMGKASDAISKANEVIAKANEVTQGAGNAETGVKTLGTGIKNLGIPDILAFVAHEPMLWLAVIVIIGGTFLLWDRYRKLTQEHV